jgi:hypothetical protein
MLSFHCVRAITSSIVGFYFIPRELYPADILSKYWGYNQIRERLKSLLFRKRNMADIIVENTTSQAKGSDNILVGLQVKHWFLVVPVLCKVYTVLSKE